MLAVYDRLHSAIATLERTVGQSSFVISSSVGTCRQPQACHHNSIHVSCSGVSGAAVECNTLPLPHVLPTLSPLTALWVIRCSCHSRRYVMNENAAEQSWTAVKSR